MCGNFFVEHDRWFFNFTEFHTNSWFVSAGFGPKGAVFGYAGITCFAVTTLFIVV
jgi:hypothetical protein